jgi:hypothetical protein
MTDVTERLVAVLERLERETLHTRECNRIAPLSRRRLDRWDTADGVLWDAACTCDYGERLRLAIAQRIEAGFAAASGSDMRMDDFEFSTKADLVARGVAAFESTVRDQETP